MDARELRIGNKVLVNGLHGENVVMTVSSITARGTLTNDKRVLFFEEDNEQVGEFAMNCSPIHLTEEWLLRADIIKSDHDISHVYSIEINNSLRTTVYLMPVKNGWCIEIGSRTNGMVSFRKEIKYVHELQNLFFALTGQELTIKEGDSFYELENKHRNGC